MTLHELTVEEMRKPLLWLVFDFWGKSNRRFNSTNTSQFFLVCQNFTTRLYSLNALKFNTTIPLLLLLSPVCRMLFFNVLTSLSLSLSLSLKCISISLYQKLDIHITCQLTPYYSITSLVSKAASYETVS